MRRTEEEVEVVVHFLDHLLSDVTPVTIYLRFIRALLRAVGPNGPLHPSRICVVNRLAAGGAISLLRLLPTFRLRLTLFPETHFTNPSRLVPNIPSAERMSRYPVG